MPLVLALIAAAQVVSVVEATSLGPRDLARRVLRPEEARKIVGGAVHRQFLPFPSYRALFWEKPAAFGDAICRRRMHGVTLESRDTSWSVDPGLQLKASDVQSGYGYALSFPESASARNCARVKGYAVPHAADTDATLSALRQLREAMQAARSGAALPFELSCTVEDSACASSREALASLPLEVLGGVDFNTGAYRVEDVIKSADGKQIGVVRRMIPAPDGSPPIGTVSFGASGADGRSWRVGLVNSGGRLHHVDMKRTMIIYH